MLAVQKRKAFRRLLRLHQPLILIGIHDTLSAKLVERKGWKALWSSSFGFSAVSGFADANLLTFSENLETIVKINHQTRLPLIADCDNGYGDLIIFNRVVREFEEAGVTGICIEDNIFPKRNSFYNKDTRHELVSIQEHVAKIKLAVHVRKDKNFFIIARTEALTAQRGMKEALKRAEAYAKAGADAICIQSKKENASELITFASRWRYSIPLVAIPTTYYSTSPQSLYKAGYKIIIFANQLLRASVQSIKSVLTSMRNESERFKAFKYEIATLEEIFDVTGVDEMKKIEKKFSK